MAEQPDWRTTGRRAAATRSGCAQRRGARRVPARPLHAGELEALAPPAGGRAPARRRACPTPRSPSASAARPPRSPASRTGCATARAATGSCSTGWRGGAVTRRGLLRLALPSKGRMHEPAARLLHGRRHRVRDRRAARCTRTAPTSTSSCCSRAPTTSPSGRPTARVDVGIAGRNQLVEAGADARAAARLGFGRCRLALAVPTARPVAIAADLAGCRVATSYPRHARGALRASRASRRAWSRSTARSSWRRGCTPPTRSPTSSPAARRCARTACASSRRCSSREAVLIARPRPRRRSSARSTDELRCCIELGARGAAQALPDAERAATSAWTTCSRCCRASTRRPCCRSRAPACTPCTPWSTPTRSSACSARCARPAPRSLLVLPIEHLIP